jgi:SlyX protein
MAKEHPGEATARFEQRLEELETRLAFQEQAILELSDALAASRREVEQSEARVQRALAELRHGMEPSDPGLEPPPPHY